MPHANPEERRRTRKRKSVEPGTTFGALATIREVDAVIQGGKPKRRFECRCVCGRVTVVALSHLTDGHTTSCGCTKSGRIRVAVTTHGRTHTPLYNAWDSIKQRCFNKENRGFPKYGGRGITMHAEWIDDFEAFAEYMDIHLGPRPHGYSIDRIDNEGHYEPGNLRWADAVTQRRNQRWYYRRGRQDFDRVVPY